MRVWMINPRLVPSGGRLSGVVIISNEASDLLLNSSIVVKTENDVIGRNTTIEEKVREYEKVGFAQVMPVKESVARLYKVSSIDTT